METSRGPLEHQGGLIMARNQWIERAEQLGWPQTMPVSLDIARVPALHELADVVAGHGYGLYVVGGTVRQWAVGESSLSRDIDVVITAPRAEIVEWLRLRWRLLPLDNHTWHVTIGPRLGLSVAAAGVVDYRQSQPFRETQDIWEDLTHRDARCNQLAWDVFNNNLLMPPGSLQDCAAAQWDVDDPYEVLKRDPLRAWRIARYIAQGWRVSSRWWEAYWTLRNDVAWVDALLHQNRLRWYWEWRKTVMAPFPATVWKMLAEMELLELIVPSWKALRHTRWERHTWRLLSHAGPSALLRQAILFRETGRPIDPEHHAQRGAEVAAEILSRMRAPKVWQQLVPWAVEHHADPWPDDWDGASVRDYFERLAVPASFRPRRQRLRAERLLLRYKRLEFTYRWRDPLKADAYIRRIQRLRHMPRRHWLPDEIRLGPDEWALLGVTTPEEQQHLREYCAEVCNATGHRNTPLALLPLAAYALAGNDWVVQFPKVVKKLYREDTPWHDYEWVRESWPESEWRPNPSNASKASSSGD